MSRLHVRVLRGPAGGGPPWTPERDTLTLLLIWDQLAQKACVTPGPISARVQGNDRLPTRVAFIPEKSIDGCCFVFSSFFLRGASEHLFLPLLCLPLLN